VAGSGQLRKHIFGVGRARDFVVGLLRIPHAEAVDVLGREREVAHAGFLRQIEPSLRVEFPGVELGHERRVLGAAKALAVHVLLVPAADCIDAPVDEQAEALLEKPVAAVAEAARPRGLRAGEERRGREGDEERTAGEGRNLRDRRIHREHR
jgi:hypothetical protein